MVQLSRSEAVQPKQQWGRGCVSNEHDAECIDGGVIQCRMPTFMAALGS